MHRPHEPAAAPSIVPGRHRPHRATSREARARTAFAGLAVLALAALLVLYALATGSPAVRAFDSSAIATLEATDSARLHEATFRLLHTISVDSIVLLGGAIVAVALGRRRPGAAVAAAITVGGANVSTQLLKPLLGALDPLGGEATRSLPASFPSGHATVAMSLALAATFAAPPALRSLVALGGGTYAAAVGAALLALGWHYPSDIAGGYLVATAWSAAAGALLLRRRTGEPRRAQPALLGTTLLAVAVAGLALVFAAVVFVAALRRPELFSYLRANTASMAASAGLAAVSLGAVAALASLLAWCSPGGAPDRAGVRA